MTVSNQKNVASYVGNGIVKEFTAPFKFFEQKNIEVYVSSESQPVKKLVLNDDYFVFGENEENGGSVIFKKAPQAGEKVVIVRVIEMTQEVDYRENEVFPAKTHERTLDKLTMIAQQISERISRCLSLGITSDENPDQILPEIFDARAVCIGKAQEAFEHAGVSADAAAFAEAEAIRAKEEADSIKESVMTSPVFRRLYLLTQQEYDALAPGEKADEENLYYIKG